MLTCRYIYLSVYICVYTCIITYEMKYTFQLLATLLTIYTYGYTHNSICLHTSTHLYTYISTMHMPMCTYFHIFTHHVYIHFSDSESLKWPAFSISTILLFFTPPSPPLIVISNSFQRIHRIEIGISSGAQQPIHGWRAAAVGSILCVLGWEFSLFCVLEYSRGARVSHCHTHTRTWNVILAARILQHTHVHTHHTL